MNGIFNIVIGIALIVGGLSGELALLGTNSPEALAGVGFLILLYGVYQALSRRGADPTD